MAEEQAALIVGASRGLGLGLAEEYLRRGWTVVATERSRSDELHALADGSGGRLTVETVDVAEAASVAALTDRLSGRTFDLVFLNAGVMGPPDLAGASDETIADVMLANAFGPAKLAYRLSGHVRRDTGVVAFMSTGMGSIADNTSGGYDVYRASKAAQNMLARSFWVREGKSRGLAVLSVNPGWVKTDMGGPGATIDVPTSVRGIADQIERARGASQHRFIGWNGRELQW